MFRCFILFIVLCPLILFAVIAPVPVQTSSAPDAVETYLVAGTDDAAGNTDVLLLVVHDIEKKQVTLIQIPRDTYYESGVYQNKINQIYPAHLTDGVDSAMMALRDAVAEAFGCRIDHYFAVPLSSFAALVDALGGVELNVPYDLTERGENGEERILIPAGHRILSGEDAVKFVRYRSGYARGDLARMDAQKLFMAACMDTAARQFSLRSLTTVYRGIHDSMTTDISFAHALRAAWYFLKDYKKTNILFCTVPGAAFQTDSGLWYYAVNRAATEELMKQYASVQSSFDPRHVLTNDSMQEIYDSTEYPFHLISREDLSSLEIRKKYE